MSSVGSVVVGSAFSRLVNVGYDGVCHILMSAFVCLHPPKNITRKMRTGNFPRKAPRTTTPREKLAEIAFCSSFPPLILQPVSELISFPLCLSPSSHGHARILLPRTNTRDGDTNVCIKCVYAEKGGEAGIGIIYSSSKKIVPSAVTGDDFYFLAFGKTKLLSLSHVSLFLGFFFPVSAVIALHFLRRQSDHFRRILETLPRKVSIRRVFSLQLPPKKFCLSQHPFLVPKKAQKQILSVFSSLFDSFFILFFKISSSPCGVCLRCLDGSFCDIKTGLKTDPFQCHFLKGPSKK